LTTVKIHNPQNNPYPISVGYMDNYVLNTATVN